MDTQEKSLALAKLMGWNVIDYGEMVRDFSGDFVSLYGKISCPLMPYSSTEEGCAQFATILLKHPKAIMHYSYDRDKAKWLSAEDGEMFHGEPTQENLLDEILRMHGVME